MEFTGFVKRFAELAVQQKQADSFVPRLIGSMASYLVGLPRTRYNYAAEVGNGLGSSVVMPVIQWIQRAFPEARLTVQEPDGAEMKDVDRHPLVALVRRPNRFYDGNTLWMASIYDWCWWGNSYWRILDNRGGQPGELWWMPPWSVEPMAEEQVDARGNRVEPYLTHYIYRPDGQRQIRLELNEVIHFRHGIDPIRPRLGLPPLRAVLRDIWSDDEASNFVASLLRNSAVPSVLISPDPQAGDGAMLSPTQIEAIKQYLIDSFTGDQRGAPMAIQGPMKVQRVGHSPQEMDLSGPRNTAEERVSSALGIPAAVVGYGTGLEQTKVGATMREMVGMSWENGLIPMQRIFGGTLTFALLPRFDGEETPRQVEWDYSKVAALQEDENAKADRYLRLVQGAVLMRSEARTALGVESRPDDEVYHLSNTVTLIGPGVPEPAPALPATQAPPPPPDQQISDWLERIVGKQLSDTLVQTILSQRNPPKISRAPRPLALLVNRLEREGRALELAMIRDLTEYFAGLGDQAAAVAEVILNMKAELSDIIDAARIAQGMRWLELNRLLGRIYEAHYSRVALSTFMALGESLGLETNIPDPIMRSIIATGGRRLGLIDLEEQTRQVLFEQLTEGRSAGEGIDALVRRIRDTVPAGPWRDSLTRAKTIARTETRFAQASSSIIRARDAGIQRMMIFDGRLPTSDETCIERQGLIVTLAEAEALSALEHPRGTLQAAPLPTGLIEELQVNV